MACAPAAAAWAAAPPAATFHGTVDITGSYRLAKNFTLRFSAIRVALSCRAWAAGIPSAKKEKRIELPAPTGTPLVAFSVDNWPGPGTYSSRDAKGIDISMAVVEAVFSQNPTSWSLSVAPDGDGHFSFTHATGYSSTNGKPVTASGTDTWTCS